jgi:N-methylhydantoinase B
MSKSISPLQLGIVWQRLTGLMDEVAQTFVRTSFSVVVRENWDLACSLMDPDGRVFAQSSRSIPSFLGTMPRTLAAILQRHPKHTLEPGDVLISNDPWLGTGHLNDITMVRPILRGSDLVGLRELHALGLPDQRRAAGAPAPVTLSMASRSAAN